MSIGCTWINKTNKLNLVKRNILLTNVMNIN